jgi:hypothetical protein
MAIFESFGKYFGLAYRRKGFRGALCKVQGFGF